jgi:peptidoglycan-N-acetylglucosamine deacetylase
MALVWLAAGVTLQALEPGRLYTRGSTESRRIALSFDDGPGPETMKFLAMLDQNGVKATFFLLGEAVELRGAMVQEIVGRGHEVASHSSTHVNYLQHVRGLAAGRSSAAAEEQARRDLLADLQRTHLAIQRAGGGNVRLLRMPHGIDRPWIKTAAREMGYTLVNWTYGADWQPGSAEQLLPGYLNALQPGTIFLFHDGGRNRSKSLQLAEAVIRSAQQQGYSIVTVGQLLGANPTWERDFRVGARAAKPD